MFFYHHTALNDGFMKAQLSFVDTDTTDVSTPIIFTKQTGLPYSIRSTFNYFIAQIRSLMQRTVYPEAR